MQSAYARRRCGTHGCVFVAQSVAQRQQSLLRLAPTERQCRLRTHAKIIALLQ
jgi:hypothetical protein